MFRRLFSRRSKADQPSAKKPLPQLAMVRDHLEDLPDVIVPEGYALRTYRPGDEAAWCAIMEGNVGRNWTVERCRKDLIDDPRFHPESLFFVTCDGEPVASACAWRKSVEDRNSGTIHMVAALESHRGKGLGHLLNAAVLHRLRDLGYEQCTLATDEWRVPAIKSYLAAGLRPDHTHESHPERWKAVFAQLGLPEP